MATEITQGTVEVRNTQVREINITLGHGVLSAPRSSNFSTKSPDRDLVRLHFGTRGDYSFHWPQAGETFHLMGGHCNIIYSEEFSLEVENSTALVETFGVHLPRERFMALADREDPLMEAFCNKLERKMPCALGNRWGGISGDLQVALNEVRDDLYGEPMRQHFVLSKCVELMVATSEACARSSGKEARKVITRADRVKVIAARDLVNGRLNDPPSLSEVSAAVGLNEFKLKQGFKEAFGTTLFKYLTSQRLHIARKLLAETDRPVQDIAYDLGYGTPQHFTNAFHRMFGEPPSGLRISS